MLHAHSQPSGLAVIQRQGSDSLGEPFHVKVVVASVVVNGRPLNNNLVALLVGQVVERMLRAPGAVVVAANDRSPAVPVGSPIPRDPRGMGIAGQTAGGDSNGRH